MSGIGVVLDSFREPAKEALRSAAGLGFRRIEMPVVGGEVDPAELSRTGRRDLLHYISGLGLDLSALGAGPGSARAEDSSAVEQRLNKTRQIMEMARELGVPVVSTQLGRVDAESMKKGHLLEAVRYLAEMSDRIGVSAALETTSADPEAVAALLKEADCRSLGVCYDPGSLLIDGFDALAGVEPLADRIFIARARDAVAGTAQRPGRETPLGQGQLDLAEYLAKLDQAGYRGVPFIRRIAALRPLQEVAEAKRHIETLLG